MIKRKKNQEKESIKFISYDTIKCMVEQSLGNFGPTINEGRDYGGISGAYFPNRILYMPCLHNVEKYGGSLILLGVGGEIG